MQLLNTQRADLQPVMGIFALGEGKSGRVIFFPAGASAGVRISGGARAGLVDAVAAAAPGVSSASMVVVVLAEKSDVSPSSTKKAKGIYFMGHYPYVDRYFQNYFKFYTLRKRNFTVRINNGCVIYV